MTWRPDMPEGYRNQIVTGDAKVLAEAIPDASIDLILCDPVYWRTEDYEWLAHLAERVLFEGGSVIAQVGSEYRYEAETVMRRSVLTPCPLLAEVYASATAQMWKYQVFTGWKPYLWLSKGRRKGRWVFDRLNGGGCAKGLHKWGDSGLFALNYIERLTEPGAVVLDPFTGSGTIPACCVMLGRSYIAFEIMPEVAERARRRVADTQPILDGFNEAMQGALALG